jgi:CBS-domain-containing membrane protein
MNEWKQTLVNADAALRDVLARIDASSLQITLVVDADGRLEGTITDGDIRRAFLKGLDLDAPAASVMNRTPITMVSGDDDVQLLALMRNKRIRQIPIIDSQRHVVGLQTFDELTTAPVRDNIVVLMAGGLGTRLLPLTANKPKPMLQSILAMGRAGGYRSLTCERNSGWARLVPCPFCRCGQHLPSS